MNCNNIHLYAFSRQEKLQLVILHKHGFMASYCLYLSARVVVFPRLESLFTLQAISIFKKSWCALRVECQNFFCGSDFEIVANNLKCLMSPLQMHGRKTITLIVCIQYWNVCRQICRQGIACAKTISSLGQFHKPIFSQNNCS